MILDVDIRNRICRKLQNGGCGNEKQNVILRKMRVGAAPGESISNKFSNINIICKYCVLIANRFQRDQETEWKHVMMARIHGRAAPSTGIIEHEHTANIVRNTLMQNEF